MVSLIWLFIINGVLSVADEGCDQDSGRIIRRDVLSIRRLKLNFETEFTWQATRGTRDLIIHLGTNVNISVSDTGNYTLELTDITDETRASKGPSTHLTSYMTLGLALTSNVLAVSQGDGGTRFSSLTLVAIGMLHTCLARDSSCARPDVTQLLIPTSLVEEICHNGECWPLICKLNPYDEYSNVPSNNDLVFEDNRCTVRKPEDWQQWLDYFFGLNSTQTYYGDFDGDGLVNILEYYGMAAFNNSYMTIKDVDQDQATEIGPQSQGKRDTYSFRFSSTNPTQADSDGDLLQDGFETYFSMDANVADDFHDDYDDDGLSNLIEQIQGTDPLNPDSDGDGVWDGDEVRNGGNPRNPGDDGQKPPNVQYAQLNLTVGDQSGSHSERYVLHVGDIKHQSPGYGLVGSGVYTFLPGTYIVTLQHAGTILPVPDYDYTALITKNAGDAVITIIDPDGMLGIHYESSYFYAADKSATIIVREECSGQSTKCQCAKLASCVECKENGDCLWVVDDKLCTDKASRNDPRGVILGNEACPCERCAQWYTKDRRNTTWLDEINMLFPCPCSVTSGTYGVTPQGAGEVSRWKTDDHCMVQGGPHCVETHPGANGCLLSRMLSPSAARQQCCYGYDGVVLPPTDPGAGTPDKSGKFSQHLKMDREPLQWCCKDCEEPSSCGRYMELRRGDTSHCTD